MLVSNKEISNKYYRKYGIVAVNVWNMGQIRMDCLMPSKEQMFLLSSKLPQLQEIISTMKYLSK